MEFSSWGKGGGPGVDHLGCSLLSSVTVAEQGFLTCWFIQPKSMKNIKKQSVIIWTDKKIQGNCIVKVS